jgi:hypothetical protein
MPKSISRQALLGGLLVACASLCAGAVYFYFDQNASNRVGGPVSPQKLAWLAYAILLWFVLPAAIALDGRSAKVLKQAFGILFLLMLARGVIELWMLYVILNWSPWYGIAHDGLCAMVLAGYGLRAFRIGAWRTPPNALLLAHLAVTAVAFVPEIYFAHYMTQNFNTLGAAAVYFVPDEERYRDVLRVTAAVVVALSIYLPLFVLGWLVGTPESKRTPAF